MKKLLAGMMALGLLLASSAVFAQGEAPGVSEEQVKAAAIKAMQNNKIVFEGADIIYDEDNGLWEERVMAVEETPDDPNHGNLPGGILAEKKYQAVFFDFSDEAPTKDVWVFVDKNTGEVITFYQEK